MGFDGFIATELNGYAGGIFVVLKEDIMTITMIHMKFQFMHFKAQYQKGITWYFSPVYASPNYENRRILWENLIYWVK